MSSINFEELPSSVKFIFAAIGQSAISAKNRGMSRKEFEMFCSEIWASMEMDENKFGQFIQTMMEADIKKAREELSKHH